MDTPPQLELFATALPHASIRRGALPIGSLHIRADHAMLLTIAGLIAVTVVFAAGVERGKQVARAERPLLNSKTSSTQLTPSRAPTPSHGASERPASSGAVSPATPSPKSTPRKAGKTTVAGGPGYAIQVVSYRKPDLARRELQRLQQRGEPAFLVMKQGLTVLCVGPFFSKATASTKLTGLKRQYEDCFIRSL